MYYKVVLLQHKILVYMNSVLHKDTFIRNKAKCTQHIKRGSINEQEYKNIIVKISETLKI